MEKFVINSIANTLKIYSKMKLSDLEKIIGIKSDVLLRYLKKASLNGDLIFKIDEFQEEIEFFLENINQQESDILILKQKYEKMNNLQREIIDLSFK